MDTPDSLLTPSAATVSRSDRVFPTLAPAQIARVARHGRRRAITSGEVLVEVGQRPVPFFVVSNGEVQVLRPSGGIEALIITQGAGQFTAEGTMLTGRRALTRIRDIKPGEVIIASGARYRKPAIANVSQFEGAGVYYAASRMESQLCAGDEVAIAGGGNSAGQAAVFLAETAKHVHLLVRKDGLADTMSRYLLRRIEEHPAITLRARTELMALDGDRHLDRIRWLDSGTGVIETHDIRHVFMMTGAVPNTG